MNQPPYQASSKLRQRFIDPKWVLTNGFGDAALLIIRSSQSRLSRVPEQCPSTPQQKWAVHLAWVRPRSRDIQSTYYRDQVVCRLHNLSAVKEYMCHVENSESGSMVMVFHSSEPLHWLFKTPIQWLTTIPAIPQAKRSRAYVCGYLNKTQTHTIIHQLTFALRRNALLLKRCLFEDAHRGWQRRLCPQRKHFSKSCSREPASKA